MATATPSREVPILSMLSLLSPETCRVIADDLAEKYAAAEQALGVADERVRVADLAAYAPDAPYSASVELAQARKASEQAWLERATMRLMYFHANYRAAAQA